MSAHGDDEVRSDVRRPDDDERLSEAIRDITGRRSIIDQAKGMLMFVYGIDADAAFGLLRWQSQHHNVKVRVMAEQLLADFGRASRQRPPVDRRRYDELLVTVHTRTDTSAMRDVVGEMAVRVDD